LSKYNNGLKILDEEDYIDENGKAQILNNRALLKLDLDKFKEAE
jgi:hypothetical protein